LRSNNVKKKACQDRAHNEHPELYTSRTGDIIDLELPKLPRNIMDWIAFARPTVGYTVRRWEETPFWEQIYNDNHPDIMVVAGRQTYKTTFCTDLLGCYATSRPRSEICLVEDNEAHLSAVSKQRVRIETFLQNPILRQFLRHDRGNIGEISLGNDSVLYLVTDEGEYKKVEGKSLQLLILDEAQYQDIQFLQKARYAIFKTHGKFFCLGIGGEAGSDYHKMWLQTDQREWKYDNPYWREKLEFDSEGGISNSDDKLRSILSGSWVANRPEHTEYRGYHLPQPIFATIPLTIDDAVLKYKVRSKDSIEYQEMHSPHSILQSHCYGAFYKAERRPVTPDMVEACYVPYLSFLSGEQVRELKDIYGNEVRVLLGVDFGSGPAASKTVISIILHWRKTERYQLAWLDPRPQEHQLDQARYIANLGKEYGIDIGVGDLGYGQIQVKLIQDGGRDSHDTLFEGLGRKIFHGCRTYGDETKPHQEFRRDTDEHGEIVGRFQIDKTTVIQNLVDRMDRYVSHPTRQLAKLRRTQIMLPWYKSAQFKIEKLKDDLCSILRKDLEEIQDVQLDDDPRQKAKREFNHPRDSVMAMIYCFVGDEHFDEDAYDITAIG